MNSDATTVIVTANAIVEKQLRSLYENISKEKGIVGPKGDPGEKGDTGEKGDKRDKGDKGDPSRKLAGVRSRLDAVPAVVLQAGRG